MSVLSISGLSHPSDHVGTPPPVLQRLGDLRLETKVAEVLYPEPCRKTMARMKSRRISNLVMRELRVKTQALYRGLKLVLDHHRCPREIVSELYLQLTEYMEQFNSEKLWLKHAKRVLAEPIASFLRTDPPESTGNDFIPVGRLKKWMDVRLRCFNARNVHLWFSWLQCKRSCLPVWESTLEQNYSDHLALLTKEDDGDDDFISLILRNDVFRGVLDHVRDAVADIDPDAFFEEHPSSNASFEKGRSVGGQRSALHEILDSHLTSGAYVRGFKEVVVENLRLAHLSDVLPDIDSRSSFSIPDGCDYLSRMDVIPLLLTNAGRIPHAVVEFRESSGRQKWKNLLPLSVELSSSLPTNLKCTVQGILEPNKVRTITKGEALSYYSVKPIQQALHSCLREMPCFRLIGRPLCNTDILDIRKKSSDTDLWFSIDYKNATDNLSYKYSSKILNHVISGLPDRVKMMCERVLGPHELYYPPSGLIPCGHDVDSDRQLAGIEGCALCSRSKNTIYGGVQKRGQLMGSILSFPILCLANLGVYLETMRSNQFDWTHDEVLNHVLINGDDMLYCAPEWYWDRHVENGRKVGLEMSVGKAYRHRAYANINSCSVILSLDSPNSLPRRVDFLNTGMFFGQRKVLGKLGLERVRTGIDVARHTDEGMIDEIKYPVTSVIPNLLEGCLPSRQQDILKQYMSHHKDVLREECDVESEDGSFCPLRKRKFFSRNLFLPISIGGMGIVAPLGFNNEITINQRKLALKNFSSQVTRVDVQRPLRGFDAQQYQPHDSVPWVASAADLKSQVCSLKNVGVPSRRCWRFIQNGFLPYVDSRHHRWVGSGPDTFEDKVVWHSLAFEKDPEFPQLDPLPKFVHIRARRRVHPYCLR